LPKQLKSRLGTSLYVLGDEFMKKKHKKILKRCFLTLLVLIVLLAVGAVGAFQYAKYRFFRDTPNTLTFKGDLHSVPFEWSADESESYNEPHGAILIPVSVPGLPNRFYMQFDTGSPNTYIRRSAMEALKDRGIEIELIQDDDRTLMKELELDVGGNRIVLTSGWIYGQNVPIDWDNPNAKNVIGTLGSDFLDQKICEIDFPAKEIRLHRDRPDSLNELGDFTPFKFKGRRILLPANIDGSNVEVFYDSGCSAFGLLTSKYQYDRLTDPNDKEIAYGANRRGESIPIHHRPSDLMIKLGETELSVQRISYAEMYNFLQTTVGRFVGGGFFGNKSLLECTLILDTKSNEFLVVKNSLQDPSTNPKSPVQIPFTLTEHNNISIEAVVNGKHKLALMFHTAVNEVSLTESALEKLPEIKLGQQIETESWGGKSTTPFATGQSLSIESVHLDDVTIFRSMHSGHQTDGKFGPRQLQSQIFEIDFDRSKIVLHDTLPSYLSNWEQLPLTIENGLMFVEGNIHNDQGAIKQKFMIHSGYSGFALLDDEFVSKHPYISQLNIIDESELTDSSGKKLLTKKSLLPEFSIGTFRLENVPVSFFGGSIGRQKFSVLGGDFLKRYNMVFDLENETLYLKKSADGH